MYRPMIRFTVMCCIAFAACQTPVDGSTVDQVKRNPRSIHGAWQTPSGSLTMTAQVLVTEHPPGSTYFYSNNFGLENDGHGYIGIQGKTLLPDNTFAKTAMFSIWDATFAAPGTEGTWCVPFSGEGVGISCRAWFDWTPGVVYYFAVYHTGISAGGFALWTGYVVDTANNRTVELGTIQAPPGANSFSGNGQSWIENYGGDDNCTHWGITGAYFTAGNAFNDTVPGSYVSLDSSGGCMAAAQLDIGLIQLVSGGPLVVPDGVGQSCGIEGEFAGSCIDGATTRCNGTKLGGLCPGSAEAVCCGNPPG